MWVIFLEAGLALGLALFIVWFTMNPKRQPEDESVPGLNDGSEQREAPKLPGSGVESVPVAGAGDIDGAISQPTPGSDGGGGASDTPLNHPGSRSGS